MKSYSSLLLVLLGFGCDYHAPVGDTLAVVAISPANGAGSGPAASSGAGRPTFRWRASPSATGFQLQVDDSCDSAAACTFPSPEIDERGLATTTYAPTADLTFSNSPPVGRRYFWRVRACTGDTCGSWSAVRYVVVGRTAGALNTDLNGDGYPDLVVGAPESGAEAQQAGQVFVYLGGPTFSSSPALVIGSSKAHDELGSTVAMVGDVNGDGFGDFLVRTNGDESTPGVAPTPRVLLFFGGTTLHTEPGVTLVGGIVDDENMAAAGAGDLNGDGYDDIAFAATDAGTNHMSIPPSRVEIHFGGPTIASAPDLTLLGEAFPDFFGSSVAGAGDVNGDGYPDLVVGAHQSQDALGNKVRIYFGGPSMDDVADVTLISPAGPAGDLFGHSVAIAGDVNGDGFDDVVVGAPGSDAYPGGPLGRAYIYFGGSAIHTAPDLMFASTMATEWFAKTVAPAGDVNGDGFADIAVVTRGVEAPHLPLTPTGRRVDLFFGGSAPDATADTTLSVGSPDPSARGFAATDLDGDGVPDLIVGQWVSDYQGIGQAAVYLGRSGYSTPVATLSGPAPADAFGGTIGR